MKPVIHSGNLVRLIEGTIGQPRFGVEIGVERGRTSQKLFESFPDLHLVGVDPWAPMSDLNPRLYRWAEQEKRIEGGVAPKRTRHAFRTHAEHQRIYRHARAQLRPYRDRWTILRMTSADAAVRLAGREFDFVFIDGDHTRCGDDIAAYWPLVRSGGLLCGHDYGTKMSLRGIWDIDHAVNSFVTNTGLKLLRHNNFIWGVLKP